MERPDQQETRLLAAKGETLLPRDIEALRRLLAGVAPDRVAIAEIAGRDSIAAAVAVAKSGQVDALVPTAVYTGTEYGDWSALYGAVDQLTRRLAGSDATIAGDLSLLGSPSLWGAVNGRYMRRLSDAFGYCSPCIGCHLYIHLMRVPLAWELGVRRVISGERESHDGRVKVNQIGAALDAYSEVMSSAGIELMLPIRSMAHGAEVQELVGDDWAEGDRQLKCVLGKNYEATNSDVTFDRQATKEFLDRFIGPAGRAVVEAWRGSRNVVYSDVIGAAIEALGPVR